MHPASSLVPPHQTKPEPCSVLGPTTGTAMLQDRGPPGGVMGAGGPGAGTEGLFEEGSTSCPWLSGQLTYRSKTNLFREDRDLEGPGETYQEGFH